MKAQYKHFEKEVEEIKDRIYSFDEETSKETLDKAQEDISTIEDGLEEAMNEVEDEESATFQSLEELSETVDIAQETLDDLLAGAEDEEDE